MALRGGLNRGKKCVQQRSGKEPDPSAKKQDEPRAVKGGEAEDALKEDVRAKLGQKGPLLAQRIWSDLGGEKIRDLREPVKKRGRSPGKTNKVATELAKKLSRKICRTAGGHHMYKYGQRSNQGVCDIVYMVQ
jgi:hypothetical protein